MKKCRFTKKLIKITAYVTAFSILFGQVMVSTATEEKSQVSENSTPEEDTSSDIKYIVEITTPEDAYLTYEEKPSLEELQETFPDTLTVITDEEEDTIELEVVWECETDYEEGYSGEGKEVYIFIPKWDDDEYVLSEEIPESIEVPVIKVEVTHGEEVQQIEDLEAAQEDLQGITKQKSVLAVVYLCDKYEVKDRSSKNGSTVVSVVSGQSVQIVGVDLDEEGNVWYKVSFYVEDKNYKGYIEKQYLATSDEIFLDWTDEYVEETEEVPANKIRTMSIMTLSNYPDINQFPASYQNALLSLKQKYPNWIFVKMDTGIDFNTAVSNEMKNDRSWISSSKPASWQNGAAAQSGWSLASEGILRYYMDPRNFLTDSAIFQFEQLTYNASYHTESAVQAIIASSFMSGGIPGENMTYAGAFTKIGSDLKISPFHLASRVLQEQGTNGTSPLISGTYKGFEGYYNYFNVGASGKDTELIVRGLTEAKNRGWDSRYKSLRGGSEVIGTNYILRGQDTLYLQKFNVTSNNTYNHQYMQNIMAPASEAPNIKKAYSNTGALNNSFVFKIPVYGNMPASACSQPDSTDVITLNKTEISSLAVDKTEKLTPYVNGSMVDSVSGMTFTSSNADVATVDAQGVVKAVSPGKATITCARSNAKSASCTVTVVKAEPVVDTPVLSPVVYKTGLKLSDITLPAGWSWSNKDMLLEAGTASYPAVYTPADTTKYLTVTKQVGLKVSQAIPSCTVPENLSAKMGSKLGSIALPSGFSWESDAETVLDKAGEKTFYLTYDPNDKNYLELNHIPVVVKVTGDSTEPEDPDNQGGTLPGGSTDGGNSGSNTGSGSSGTGTGSGGSNSGTGNSGTESGSTGSSTGNSGTESGDTDNSKGGSGTGSNGSGSNTGNPGTDSDSDSGNGGTTSSGSTNTGTTGNDSENSGSSENDSTSTGSNGSSTTSSGSTSSGKTNSGSSDQNNNQNNGSTTGSNNTSTDTTNNKGTNGSGSSKNDNATNSSSTANSVTSSTPADSSMNTTNSNTPANNKDVGTSAGSSGPGTAGDNNGPKQNDTANSSNTNNSVTSSAPTNNSAENKNTVNNNASTDNNKSGSTLSADADSADEEMGENAEEAEEPVYERPAVTMNMEDVPILTAEMLEMAKEQNVDLLLKMNNRALWHVNAGTVQGNISDIDMNVLFDRKVIPTDLLEDWAQGNEYLEFTLAHDGAFGFGAELEILLNPEDCGRYANLFYFNSEEDTLEFIYASIIDEEGYARFPMEHASSYVIFISDYPMTDMPEIAPETDSGSAAGWLIPVVIILVLLAAFGTGGYFYLRKRREDDEDCDDEEDDKYDAVDEADNEDYDIEDVEDNEDYDIEDVEEDEEDYADNDNIEEVVAEDKESDKVKAAKEENVKYLAEDRMKSAQEHSVQVDEMKPEHHNTEDDWIEDEDWQEPEKAENADPYADDHAENDWIEDDEWDISNDWIDDDEWEKRENIKKTAV